MGRKTQITKEMILNAAFELLEEGGIGNVAIKSIALKLGCSTQPVSWQFGSMTELKKELYFYAGARLFDGLGKKMEGKEAIDAFFVSGVYYISLACDHPNAFRFLNVDDPQKTVGADIIGGESIFKRQFDEDAVKMLSKQFGIPPEKIGSAVRDTVIYTHGLATMMMFDSFRMPKEEACMMVYNVGIKMLSDVGIDTQKYEDPETVRHLMG